MTMLTAPGWDTPCFASLLAFAFALYYRFCPDPCSVLIDTQPQNEYDFIIIGAGSAGSVIANRLTECGNWTVLLLEAGGPETNFSDIPGLAEQLQRTQMDWNYTLAPPTNGQSYCLSMINHTCFYPSGRVVGGSSVNSDHLYVRGNRYDYDDWVAMGNTGWGYDDVLAYFLKSEDNSDHKLLEGPFHSSGGYQSVQDLEFTTPLGHAFIRAAVDLGYDHRYVNGKDQEGFMIAQGTTRNGSRCSTSKAFIRPVQYRPNFFLSMNSFVTKILFETENSFPTAKAVSFIKAGKEYTAKAKTEIILSAGAFRSPQLLMLSGIGPKEHLEDFKMKCLQDLPVGYNFQDHVTFQTLNYKVDQNVTITPSLLENPDSLLKYILKGKGPLTNFVLNEAIGFVNTKYANISRSQPDIQLVFTAQGIFNGEKPFGTKYLNLRPNLFNGTEYKNLDPNGNYFTLGAILLRPESRGQITLQSTDPYDQPVVNPNFFAAKTDLKVLIDGVRILLKIIDAPVFKMYNPTPLPPFPGCQKLKEFSDEYFECCARHFTRSLFHAAGTCKMGVDSNSVVDPRLRVYGVTRLRVVDCSIMPTIVSGSLNAPAIMIAEKAADMVKQDWAYLGECSREESGECRGDWRCPGGAEEPDECELD